MRGGPSSGRGGQLLQPMNEATARTFSQPAPYKGWNAIGNLANMNPLQAVQMDNVFPGVQDVAIRPGCIDWATAAPANIQSLLAYSGPVLNKLFGATATAIYDVSSQGAIGASVHTITAGYISSLMTATSGGNFMFCVNGSDAAFYFDGTSWVVPTITGTAVDTTKWSFVGLHKRRIWAVQKNSMNLWYLGTDSIAGPAVVFPVGALFSLGGYIVAVGTYTIQYYYGPDDFFVILTSNGEIAVYQGTDPSSASTWSLVGVYNIGAPLGDHPLYKYGVDELYLGKTGLLQFSKLQQAGQQDTVIDQTSDISYTIQGAFLDAAASYSANKGWQMITHKSENALIVNIPVSQDTLSYQFVMNTATKAWCRFTNWNASCWAELGGDLYFAGGTKVCKAWVGTTDSGNPIVANIAQAYNPLGFNGQSQVALVRPLLGVQGSVSISMALDNDFQVFGGQSLITYMPETSGAIWGTSLWGTGVWDAGATLYQPTWLTVPNNLGYLHSMRMQITSSSGSFIWTSTNYAIKPAGVL